MKLGIRTCDGLADNEAIMVINRSKTRGSSIILHLVTVRKQVTTFYFYDRILY